MDRHLVDGDVGLSEETLPPADAQIQGSVPQDVPLQPAPEALPPGHFWTMIAQFKVSDTQMQLLDEARHTPGANVPMEMSGETLMSMDGPGCIKCGVHWSSGEGGLGTQCPVDKPASNGLVLPNKQGLVVASAVPPGMRPGGLRG